MNLNYTIEQIAEWTNARVVGSSSGTIKNISIDSRSPLIAENTLFIALKGNKSDGHIYCGDVVKKGAKVLLVEKELLNLKATQIIVNNTITALQNIATNHRKKFNLPVIGITGSNGKTTIKEWLYHVLKQKYNIVRSPKSYNSQIGVPLSVLELKEGHQLAIFEAGISQPNEMDKLRQIIQPTIGIFTGIGDAHQINFTSQEDKKTEKFKLFEGTENLIQFDNTLDWIDKTIPFSDEASRRNANIVYQTAIRFGLDQNEIIDSLSSLPHISMRMERMEGNNGNAIINDTYTFDEKGLEIGLQYISSDSAGLEPVLILAPDNSYVPSKNLINLIKNSSIKQLVWIYPEEISISNCKTSHYPSVNDYLASPINFTRSIILFSGSRKVNLEKSLPFYIQKKHITRLEIDLSKIRDNLNYYRSQLASKTAILAMVKAQSYGGGISEMAQFLDKEKVDYLGVAYSDEGVTLRGTGINLPILVMNPEQDAFEDIIQHKLEPSIYSFESLNKFLHYLILKGKKRFPIHIKLDTGMHRLGFQSNQIRDLINTLNVQPEVYVKSVFSHFAAADNSKESAFTLSQIELFAKLTSQIEDGLGYKFDKHIANSEGTLNYKTSHFDMVRLGIGLFGLSRTNRQLAEALSFKTQISQIKTIEIGESVGYGRKFIAGRQTSIGIIPVGYADGLSRQLGNGNWSVQINGEKAPIIGSICMDMCMIDITGLSCKVGTNVDIFGWSKSIFDMADHIQSIPYEVISTISSRVHRVYLD